MTEVARTVELFVRTELRSGHRTGAIALDDDLIGSGIIDSLGIQDLVAFLEDRFAIRIASEDIVPENFQSLQRVERFVEARIRDAQGVSGRQRRSRWG